MPATKFRETKITKSFEIEFDIARISTGSRPARAREWLRTATFRMLAYRLSIAAREAAETLGLDLASAPTAKI